MVNYLVNNSWADEWDSAHFSTGKTEAPAIVELMLSTHEGLDSTPSTTKEEGEEKKKKRSLGIVVQVCNPRSLEVATGDLRI